MLITLAIIGFIAALTIPGIVQNYQKTETVARLKKTYSILNQAYNASRINNGSSSTWKKPDIDITLEEYFKSYLQPYLKIQLYCTTFNEYCKKSGYSVMRPWKYKTGGTVENNIAYPGNQMLIMLNDGTAISLRYDELMYIDINGSKGPNILGRDVFIFQILDKGILPYLFSYGNNYHCTGESTAGCAKKIMKDGWQILDDYPW